MEVNGIKATSGVATSLVHAFASARRIDIAAKLVTSICRKHTRCLETLAPLLSVAYPQLPPIDCKGIQPSTSLFNALLKHALQQRGLKALNIILTAMRFNEVLPDEGTLETFVTYLYKKENIHPRLLLRLLRQLFSSVIRPTPRHLHSILGCVLRHEKFLHHGSGWNAAAAHLSHSRRPKSPDRRIRAAGPLDPSAGLQLTRRMGYRSLTRAIIKSLVSSGAKSDAATFALRIRHDAVVNSDIESAEAIFRTLLSRGIHATEYHYGALLEGYALAGDMNRAEAILKSMTKVGLKPNVVLYTILIVGYGRSGKLEKALEAFQRMVDDGCKPDVPAIDALCRALFASGAYALAKRALVNCWAYIQPFPDEYRSLSLKELSVRFRSLHTGDRGVPKSVAKRHRRMLHFRTRNLVQKWKAVFRPTRRHSIYHERRLNPRVPEHLAKQDRCIQ